ncbi:MAG: DEAD/DEAH box helicase [Candidatus Saccharibacteria bacterium]|nr:DEAD/DEAH box helicase [Rhodoferax sp.]
MKYRSPEQTAYAKLISGALHPGPPLLAGATAGLGKTHGFTIPLVQSGKRVAVVLSTRQLIDQYLGSDALQQALAIRSATVVALRTRRQFATNQQYREHKQLAMAADVLVLTHAGAFIDSFMPGYADLRSRDVLLFDEADLLADAADLRSTFCIDRSALEDCAAEDLGYLEAAIKVKKLAEADEDRAAASAIIYALKNPAWYREVGKEESGALTLKHRMPGRMLKRLITDSPRCIFTSGTLQVSGRFDYFVKTLGLQAIAPESRHIDPVKHGTLDVELAPDPMTAAEMASRISAAQRPVLVLTTSHATTAELGSLCHGATARLPGEPLSDALSRCPNDGIFIAAGAWSGLDDPRLRWKTVVIPKTPYLRPTILDDKPVSRYLDSKVVALRRTNQGLHRGLRTPNAHCTLLLLDPRSGRDELREAIPARFKVSWEFFEEGSLVVRTHLVEEKTRSAALRSAALKYHGCKCAHENCTVTAIHLLDVHHIKPIALGARKTTMDDVVVLCKNHHAEAHHQMRMADLSNEDSPASH